MNLDHGRLLELLVYDPDSGDFVWLEHQRGGQGAVVVRAGTVAGCVGVRGYRVIRVLRKLYPAHRLAWFWVTGRWPILIDHINRIKTDNRWSNLREANKSINSLNVCKASSHSTIGLRGVVHAPSIKNPFAARLTINGVQRHLGCFPTAEAAHTAYLTAKVAALG